jgi:hypothetical protein
MAKPRDQAVPSKAIGWDFRSMEFGFELSPFSLSAQNDCQHHSGDTKPSDEAH